MNTLYIPRADSLADKVCRFLLRLPDEELLTREISAKFGAESKNVGNNLVRAVEAGYLTQDGSVYSAGPRISKFAAALSSQPQPEGEDSPVAASATPTAPPPAKKRNGPFWIDPKTVQIDKGVPMGGRSTAIDWSPLLDALQVGDSFLLPAAAKSAISTAMKAYKDATKKVLASRKVEDGIRVWRLE